MRAGPVVDVEQLVEDAGPIGVRAAGAGQPPVVVDRPGTGRNLRTPLHRR